MPGPEMPPAIAARLARLRQVLAEQDLDAMLISQPDNRRYLSGFTGSAGWLLISADAALFATDFRYYEQMALQSPGFELVQAPRGLLPEVVPVLLDRAGAHRIGFEADYVTYADAQAWAEAAPGLEWIAATGVVMALRNVKDPGEVNALRRAIALGDEALAAILPRLRPGMTEREAAWLIESYIRTHGAESVAFETIVAGGPNGAQPHHETSDAPLPAGEPIVIDMGARLDGYNGDLTRTVCLGQPNDPGRFWEIYNLVRRAQEAAEAAARPGVTGKDVDGVARDMIAAGGYGAAFGHGLGHGLGLAVHESLRFSQTYTGALQPGNVITVEPGIYLPGWGGVRIEDVILLTEDGCEILTSAPKDPILPVHE